MVHLHGRRAGALAAWAAAVLVLAGCGGGEVSPQPTRTVTHTPAPTSEEPTTDAPTPASEPLSLDEASVRASTTTASSTDANGNPVDYSPGYMVDGDPTTAWRADGDGVGYELVIDLGDLYHVTSVGLIPGYAKSDGSIDRFAQNRRIERVTWDFSDGTSVEQSFEDAPTMQSVTADATTTWVRVHIDASTEDGGRDNVAISDVSIEGYPAS